MPWESRASVVYGGFFSCRERTGGVEMAVVREKPVREEKKQIVAEIAEKLRTSKSAILADYRGLNVAQMTELRKKLREAGCEIKVYKNTLARRATAEVGLTELDPFLVGPTAIAFGPEDPVAPAKILAEFAKENEALELKAGVVEGRVVSAEEIKAIAKLPSREGLLAMLLSVLQAPIRNFALAVKAVADKKEQESA
jgi:Ribosomal protein L10